MKINGKTTRTTVVEGEIDTAELQAYVRQTLHVPDGVELRFFAGEAPHDVDLNVGVPLRFSMVIMTQAPLAAPELTTDPA